MASDGFFYHYRDGCWHKLDDLQVRQTAKMELGRESTQHRIKEVVENLKLDYHCNPTELNGRPDLLNVRNGMLDLSTFRLLSHDPAYHSTIQLSVSYQQGAKCPMWIKFLDQIFKGGQEEIEFVREWMGHLYSSDTRQEKMLALLGSGANGKGTMIAVIEDQLGEANFSAVPLHQLCRPYYLAELHGKLLNVSSESGAAFLRNTEVLKQLVSGDTIHGEHKYKNPFKFKPYARLMFAMNELPRVSDASYGFFRRLVILPFVRTFKGKRCNRNLKESLLPERDGVFLWALEGLKRFHTRGYFMVPKSSTTSVKRYREETDSPVLFVRDACILSPNASVQANALYKKYTEWVKDNGHRSLSNVKFAERITNYFNGRITRKRTSRGNLYRGLTVKTPAEIKMEGIVHDRHHQPTFAN